MAVKCDLAKRGASRDRPERDLVPLRSGKGNLYTHLFRAVYATIAALKRLTHCGQSVIYDVLNSRASEIQFHHDKHQLGIYHNQKGKNSTKIESVFS